MGVEIRYAGDVGISIEGAIVGLDKNKPPVSNKNRTKRSSVADD